MGCKINQNTKLMKKFLILFTLLVPLLGLAQTKQSTTPQITFEVKYQQGYGDSYNGYSWIFYSDGTGIRTFPIDTADEIIECPFEISWTKKTPNKIVVKRNIGDEIVVEELTIKDSKTICDEYGSYEIYSNQKYKKK